MKDQDEIQNTSLGDNTNSSSSTQTLLGAGTRYQMEQVHFTDTWRTHVNEFDSEGNAYFWFNVETSDGKNITSTVYKQVFEDFEKKYQMLDLTIWGTFLIIVVGAILILTVAWKTISRPAKGVNNDGIFILGSQYFLKPTIGKRTNVEQLTITRIRSILVISIIILMVIFIIFSISMGLFNELINETGG